jgi:peptide/nickel transport system permease protein
LLVYVFAVKLGWFPASGAGAGLADKLYHLTLPAIALAFAGMAYISRVTRSAMNAELVHGHVDMARSRGIPESLVIRRHVMRNALVPVTTVVGISIAALIAGDVVVEQAFSIGGLGSFLVSAVTGKDFAVVQAIMLILVLVFVVVNTVADVIVANLDPRIRLDSQRS